MRNAHISEMRSNVSFKRGKAGEAGWRKYFTGVVPYFIYFVRVFTNAILASTTGTLYLPKPDKNFRLY